MKPEEIYSWISHEIPREFWTEEEKAEEEKNIIIGLMRKFGNENI